MTADPRFLATSADPLAALVAQATCPARRLDDGAVMVARPSEVVQVLEDARRVPVAVLAEALGVGDPEAAVSAVDRLCGRLAPMLSGRPLPAVPGLPVGGSPTTRAPVPASAPDPDVVDALVAAVGPLSSPHVIAVLWLLLQAPQPHAPALEPRPNLRIPAALLVERFPSPSPLATVDGEGEAC